MQSAETFFRVLFGPTVEGYVCMARLSRQTRTLREVFFRWPDDCEKMLEFAMQFGDVEDVYFCPQILSEPKRKKEFVNKCPVAWADLDTCDITDMQVRPSIAVQSSEGRYQAYWRLEDAQEPEVAEALSRRIAYFHAGQGADRSGWDLTQLLRVPFTYNLKYDPLQEVGLIYLDRGLYRLEDFRMYPEVEVVDRMENVPLEASALSAEELLEQYQDRLAANVEMLYNTVPDGSWNEPLWQLQMFLFEAGMSPAEVFVVAREAACNKFRRDNRPDIYLWHDVVRASERASKHRELQTPSRIAFAPLLTDSERELANSRFSFVDEYQNWASQLGDAAEQYHQAGAFIVLSALLSGCVRLPTSFGIIKPNLWFMILADTTLTRKSTAMDIATDLLEEVDSSILLATDGSVEGLMGSLATRPGQPSIYLRDEFSGLLESITKKDYYAGMAETFTKLYDGKMQKRILRKEVIEVKDPVLMIFAGGIRDKVCGLLSHEHVSSGFIPRFVFITAESNLDRVQPIGPPTEKDTTGRERLLFKMRKLVDHYHIEPQLKLVDGNPVLVGSGFYKAAMRTQEVWDRYNAFERTMMAAGLMADAPELYTPAYDRLCKSGLKAAVLLAAERQRPDREDPVVVDMVDLLKAFSYVELWREHTNIVISNIGVGRVEKELRNLFNYICKHPGVSRSKLMQTYHLTARATSAIFDTLEQRGLISRSRTGKLEQLWPTHGQESDVTKQVRKVKIHG